MGKKFAPAYANLYMADWERTIFPKCPKLPMFYCRCLDDIFGVWTHTEADFKQFISTLNGHHDSIHVKYNLCNRVVIYSVYIVFLFCVPQSVYVAAGMAIAAVALSPLQQVLADVQLCRAVVSRRSMCRVFVLQVGVLSRGACVSPPLPPLASNS
ncbi:hypothetical protein ABVT39_021509 [Epinephelus coioides]